MLMHSYPDTRFFSPYLARPDVENVTQDIPLYRGFLRDNHAAPRIGFIDETYYPPEFNEKTHKIEQGYYAISAVIVEADSIPAMREALVAQNDGHSYWHSTKAFRDYGIHKDPSKYWLVKQNIRPLMNVAGDYVAPNNNVFTLHTSIPFTEHLGQQNTLMEEARAESLASLMKMLTQRDNPVDTFVFESRDNPRHQRFLDHHDKATLARIQEHGIIPHINTVFVSPTAEPILWSSDLQAWATSRLIRMNDPSWLEQSGLTSTFYDAQTLTSLKLMPQERQSLQLRRPTRMVKDAPTLGLNTDLTSLPEGTLLDIAQGTQAREETRAHNQQALENDENAKGLIAPKNSIVYTTAQAQTLDKSISADAALDLTVARGNLSPIQEKAITELEHRGKTLGGSSELAAVRETVQASLSKLRKSAKPTGKAEVQENNSAAERRKENEPHYKMQQRLRANRDHNKGRGL